MFKLFFFTAFLLVGLQLRAQENLSNSFLFQYQNNSLITHVPQGETVYTGGHFHFNSITYLLNHPKFSLGAGIGLTFSYSGYDHLNAREFHVPLSIIQKTILPLDPVLNYVRFGISKNFLLSSSVTANDGKDYNEIKTFTDKNPLSAEVFLGWNLGKHGFVELGYTFKKMSFDFIHPYARHNIAIGVGYTIGGAEKE